MYEVQPMGLRKGEHRDTIFAFWVQRDTPVLYGNRWPTYGGGPHAGEPQDSLYLDLWRMADSINQNVGSSLAVGPEARIMLPVQPECDTRTSYTSYRVYLRVDSRIADQVNKLLKNKGTNLNCLHKIPKGRVMHRYLGFVGISGSYFGVKAKFEGHGVTNVRKVDGVYMNGRECAFVGVEGPSREDVKSVFETIAQVEGVHLYRVYRILDDQSSL